MTINTTQYQRKPFFVDAVQVTVDNMEEIATWCQGTIETEHTASTEPEGRRFIKVRVHHPLNDRQTKAFVGDWILYANKGYKVYTEKAFTRSFDLVIQTAE